MISHLILFTALSLSAWLNIRQAKGRGRLEREILSLKTTVKKQDEQLEIASRPASDPHDIINRMRDKKL